MANQFTVPPDTREPSRSNGRVMTSLSEWILETWRRAIDRVGGLPSPGHFRRSWAPNALYLRARMEARAGDVELAERQFAEITAMAPTFGPALGSPWRGPRHAGPERARRTQVRHRAKVALAAQAGRAGPLLRPAQSRPFHSRYHRLHGDAAVGAGEATGADLYRARQRLPGRRGAPNWRSSTTASRFACVETFTKSPRSRPKPRPCWDATGRLSALSIPLLPPGRRMPRCTVAAPSYGWRLAGSMPPMPTGADNSNCCRRNRHPCAGLRGVAPGRLRSGAARAATGSRKGAGRSLLAALSPDGAPPARPDGGAVRLRWRGGRCLARPIARPACGATVGRRRVEAGGQ